MSGSGEMPLVAIVNSSVDIVDFLRELLTEEGFAVVSQVWPLEKGAAGLSDWLQAQRTPHCVFAVGFPYREGWDLFRAVQAAVPSCAFVVTTTNKHVLETFVGPTDTIELVGKPFDLQELVLAVRRLVAAGHKVL